MGGRTSGVAAPASPPSVSSLQVSPRSVWFLRVRRGQARLVMDLVTDHGAELVTDHGADVVRDVVPELVTEIFRLNCCLDPDQAVEMGPT